MQPTFFLSAAALLTLASALPLNINLGAYSPALVVGDGAIEFKGGEEAEAAVAGAVQAAAAPAPAPVAVVAPPVAAQKEAFAGPILNDNTASLPIPGITKVLDPRAGEGQEEAQDARTKVKRDLAGFDRALQFAEVALTKGPDVELGTGAHGAGVGIIVDNNAATEQARGGAVVVGRPSE